MRDLSGKVVIVTGGARGQGEAEARLLARRGAGVVLTDVLDEEGRAVAASIGDAARFVAHDVSDAEGWAAVVRTAVDELGGVDGLVNNAALHWVRPLDEETAEGFEHALRINLTGPFLGIKAVLEPMRARGGGSIVNIASTGGMRGFAGRSAYAASKFGLRGMAKVAAMELGDDGIRVNTVLPGAIATAMSLGLGVRPGPGMHPSVALRRMGEPQEIAEVVAFLISDASSYVTGVDLPVDGGSLAGVPAPRRAPVEA
jgi:3alpha(or 20beta)-hydroxysteroid dehydrogenase